MAATGDPKAPLHGAVIGTAGPDRIAGTAEAEEFTGGAGDDVFVFVPLGTGHAADDNITDFAARYFLAQGAGSGAVGATVSATLTRTGLLDFLVNLTGLDLGGQTASAADDVTSLQFRLDANGPVLNRVFGSPLTPGDNDTTVFAQLSTLKGQWDPGEGEGTTLSANLANLTGGQIWFEARTAAGVAVSAALTALDAGRDRVDLSQVGIRTFGDLLAKTTEVGGSAKISVTGQDGVVRSLTLGGAPKASLTMADFIFPSETAAANGFAAIHAGRAPRAAEAATLTVISQGVVAGAMTDDQAAKRVVDTADSDTAVALQTYQFFTGKTPSAAGLGFLTNSPSNPADLNDPYYAGFSLENRYINFAINLGTVGEGRQAFAEAYGSLGFGAAVQKAYGLVIGANHAQAAGINAQAAVADITGRQAYFQAAAGGSDLGAKAAMVGYLLGEGIKADIGAYASASNAYLTDLLDGSAPSNVDLIGSYAALQPTAL